MERESCIKQIQTSFATDSWEEVLAKTRKPLLFNPRVLFCSLFNHRKFFDLPQVVKNYRLWTIWVEKASWTRSGLTFSHVNDFPNDKGFSNGQVENQPEVKLYPGWLFSCTGTRSFRANCSKYPEKSSTRTDTWPLHGKEHKNKSYWFALCNV